MTILIGLMACTTSSGDPKAVAKKFNEALKVMDWPTVEKYSTEDSKSIIGLMKMGGSMVKLNTDSLQKKLKAKTITYSEAIINGNEAKVTITENNEKTDFTLKKEKGEWKVAFEKNTLIQPIMEKLNKKGQNGGNSFEALEKSLDNISDDSINSILKQSGIKIK